MILYNSWFSIFIYLSNHLSNLSDLYFFYISFYFLYRSYGPFILVFFLYFLYIISYVVYPLTLYYFHEKNYVYKYLILRKKQAKFSKNPPKNAYSDSYSFWWLRIESWKFDTIFRAYNSSWTNIRAKIIKKKIYKNKCERFFLLKKCYTAILYSNLI